MKKLTTQILSIILTLSIAFSLAVPAFAASNTSAYQNIAPEDIASIQETYNSLTPEAKNYIIAHYILILMRLSFIGLISTTVFQISQRSQEPLQQQIQHSV